MLINEPSLSSGVKEEPRQIGKLELWLEIMCGLAILIIGGGL